MKIGIITFHWATNYGGVLQSFALQFFLQKLGFEVYIINYAPKSHRDLLLYAFKSKRINDLIHKVREHYKDKKISVFRKKYLNLTSRYYSFNELKNNPPAFEIYICGSDQVWNPFIIKTYGKPYYLGFGDDKVKRMSYSVSLGCIKYPKDILKEISKFIAKFDAISVRENTAFSVLQNAGFSNTVMMPDPTLLLNKDEVEKLCNVFLVDKNYFFFYVLQKNQSLIQKVGEYFEKSNTKTISTASSKYYSLSIEEWLTYIKFAKFVVTNSFHGAIFSILLEKPFLIIPVEGKLQEMNDRIYTLMNSFGLKERILETYDEKRISTIMRTPIDWVKIRENKKEMQEKALIFFKKHLSV